MLALAMLSRSQAVRGLLACILVVILSSRMLKLKKIAIVPDFSIPGQIW